MANFESIIDRIVRDAAAQIAQAVRDDITARLRGIGRATPIAGELPTRRRGRPPGAKNRAKARTAKRTYPVHCLRCSKAHGGPRSSFMCGDHVGTPKKEKRALLTAWKEKQGA